ncbi:protein FAM166C B [Nematostella vectensis]|uniref:protein FAM166C B n=1 Tax=Nematostella vectensis TaxID=45351 RepID=UPI00138FBB99|nr:protein FAM166C B [Nematostella vectensis]
MATDTVLNTTIHTLQDLRHLPGYAGFRPQQQWRYGDTFGNDTAKYFQDKRTAQLKRSTAQAPGTEWDAKIAFPTVYSNDPKLVVGARTRERDRWLSRPQYQLFNRHDRDWEIHDFDKKAQEHRRYLMDQSGTVPRVAYFVMPCKCDVLPSINRELSEQERVTICCPLCGRKAPPGTRNIRAHIQGHHLIPPKHNPPKSTWRDRRFRDFYFEQR